MNISNINNLTNFNHTPYGSKLSFLQNENKQINSINSKEPKINFELYKEQQIKLIEKVKNLNTSLDLVFKVDETSGKNIIQFIDSSNQEVVKQIPTEEMLKIIQQIDIFLDKNIKTFQLGNLLNERI